MAGRVPPCDGQPCAPSVMAGLVPAIHDFVPHGTSSMAATAAMKRDAHHDAGQPAAAERYATPSSAITASPTRISPPPTIRAVIPLGDVLFAVP